MTAAGGEAEAFLTDLNRAILDGAPDLPARLAGLAEAQLDNYGLLLKCARRMLHLADYAALGPLCDRACSRYPNSLDFALLRVDASAALTGPPQGLTHLLDLARRTGRKRAPAARRLERYGQPKAAFELLSAPDAAPGEDVANALALIRFHDRSSNPEHGDDLFETLSQKHPDDTDLHRAALHRAAYRHGAPGLLNVFQALGHSRALLPTLLHELLQLGATTAATRLVADHGPNAFGWPLLLRLRLQQNDVDSALEICRREIDSKPVCDRSERDFALQLQTALAANRPQAADISAATLLYPASARLSLLAAQFAFRTGDWAGAVEQLKSAHARQPGSAAHHLSLATMLIQTGDYTNAAGVLNALPASADPGTARLLNLRLARAAGDLDAIDDLHRRLQGFSHAAREKAAIARTEALLLTGRLDEARTEADTALTIWTDGAELLLLAGKINFLAGDIARARALRRTWSELTEATGDGPDTHDLVLRDAALTVQMPSLLRDHTPDSDGGILSRIGALTADRDNPTVWMQGLYRWLRHRPPGLPPDQANRTIPPRLLSYWDGETSPAQTAIKAAWHDLLPAFEPRSFDRQSATAWLDAHGHPDLAAAVQNAEAPASAADIFRIAYLAEKGGLYVDADEFPRAPVDDWLTGCTLLLTAEKGHYTIANSFIACTPNHPAIRAVLARLKARARGLKGGLETWMETGPGLMTLCLGQYLARTPDAPGLRVLKPQDYAARISTTLTLPHKFQGHHWRHQQD